MLPTLHCAPLSCSSSVEADQSIHNTMRATVSCDIGWQEPPNTAMYWTFDERDPETKAVGLSSPLDCYFHLPEMEAA